MFALLSWLSATTFIRMVCKSQAPLAGDSRHAGLELPRRRMVEQKVSAVRHPVRAEGQAAGSIVQVDCVMHH